MNRVFIGVPALFLIWACTSSTSGSPGTGVDAGTSSLPDASSTDAGMSGDSASPNDSGTANEAGVCTITYEPLTQAIARWQALWLVDDTGSCSQGSEITITVAPDDGPGDPAAGTACAGPSRFMVAHASRTKSCIPDTVCNQEVFAFYAHAQWTQSPVPPDELLFRRDNNAMWQLAIDHAHIIKTATGISVADIPYRPQSTPQSICL